MTDPTNLAYIIGHFWRLTGLSIYVHIKHNSAPFTQIPLARPILAFPMTAVIGKVRKGLAIQDYSTTPNQARLREEFECKFVLYNRASMFEHRCARSLGIYVLCHSGYKNQANESWYLIRLAIYLRCAQLSYSVACKLWYYLAIVRHNLWSK